MKRLLHYVGLLVVGLGAIYAVLAWDHRAYTMGGGHGHPQMRPTESAACHAMPKECGRCHRR